MALSPKSWENDPSTETPLSAAALIDTEERLGAYADSVAAGGVELARAEITSDVTTTSASPADVTGLEITFTVGTRPIVVEFGSVGIASSTAGCIPLVAITDGSNTVLRNANFPQSISVPTTIRKRLAPSAGQQTYKIRFQLVVAVGTGTITASSSNGNQAYITAYEV